MKKWDDEKVSRKWNDKTNLTCICPKKKTSLTLKMIKHKCSHVIFVYAMRLLFDQLCDCIFIRRKSLIFYFNQSFIFCFVLENFQLWFFLNVDMHGDVFLLSWWCILYPYWFFNLSSFYQFLWLVTTEKMFWFCFLIKFCIIGKKKTIFIFFLFPQLWNIFSDLLIESRFLACRLEHLRSLVVVNWLQYKHISFCFFLQIKIFLLWLYVPFPQ